MSELMAVGYHDEITDDNRDEHWLCTQQTDAEGRAWCLGYHCPVCGGPCSMYGHPDCRKEAT